MARARSEIVAEWLGPWSLWGVDLSPGDIRVVRLERRRGGWKATWSERTGDLGVEGWSRHRLASRGFRLAVGGLPVYHLADASEQPDLPEPIPDDLERLTENVTKPRWSLLWRASLLARACPGIDLDVPDSVHASSALLPSLLEPTRCPAHWIAVRVLERVAQVWFMASDRVGRFVELDGGRVDPALLAAEWRALRDQIGSAMPEWSPPEVAFLEDAADADLLKTENVQILDPPWKPWVRSVPGEFRFAGAAAAGNGADALVERLDGPIRIDSQGRRSASRWLLRAAAAAGGILAVSAGLWGTAAYRQREGRRIVAELDTHKETLARIDQAAERRDREERWRTRHVASGGPLAARMAALSRCWPTGTWIEDWTGERRDRGLAQELSAWTAGAPDPVSRCLETSRGGWSIQSTETWSVERWGRDKQVAPPQPLVRLGIRSGAP